MESVGLNVVAVNNIKAKKNQKLPIHHMDTIDFSADNNFVHAFHVESTSEEKEEPFARKMRFPLANLEDNVFQCHIYLSKPTKQFKLKMLQTLDLFSAYV